MFDHPGYLGVSEVFQLLDRHSIASFQLIYYSSKVIYLTVIMGQLHQQKPWEQQSLAVPQPLWVR